MPPHRQIDLISPSPRPAANVVIIDDDPDIVDSLAALLGDQGILVEGFTDPTTALDRLRQSPAPDLVLCDFIMPRLTGSELADALTAAGVDAPVVLMTGLADPEFAVDTGRMRVLSKPFVLEDLLAEIDAATRADSTPKALRKSA
ncbi:Two-component response regulator [Minicystis rosea]|nr:Two-component response regulator [Minicystis rosea]